MRHLLVFSCILLAGCPPDHHDPSRIPLPSRGDASAPDLGALTPFLSQSHTLTVKVLNNGKALQGANVLLHDSSGAVRVQIQTGADGTVHATDC